MTAPPGCIHFRKSNDMAVLFASTVRHYGTPGFRATQVTQMECIAA